jgi:hypothetical protein
MPRLDNFTLEIKTGDARGPEHPQFSINGFPLDFDEAEGSTDAGADLKATGTPRSFPHSLVLKGPEDGQAAWAIESITATYRCDGVEPYTVQLGAVTLDDHSDLNIWHEPPPVTYDV